MRVDGGQRRDLSLHLDDLHQERQGVEAAGKTGDDKVVHLDDLLVDINVGDLPIHIILVQVDDLQQER